MLFQLRSQLAQVFYYSLHYIILSHLHFFVISRVEIPQKSSNKRFLWFAHEQKITSPILIYLFKKKMINPIRKIVFFFRTDHVLDHID